VQSSGMGNKAFAVTPGQVLRVSVRVRGDAASAAGLYVLINQATTMPASGAVTFSNRASVVNILANGPATSTYTQYAITAYTVPAGVVAISVSVFSWTNGPLSLWIDDPVINLASATDNAVGPRENNDGGFEASAANAFVPDPAKTYRFLVPIWRETAGLYAIQYFGSENNKVCNLNTSTLNGNPYFTTTSTLTAGRWYLAVGYVYPAGSTGMTHTDAGVWDTTTGAKLQGGANYCWPAAASSCGVRAFQFAADNGSETRFGQPMVHVVDGTEPPLGAWLAVTTADIAPDSVTRFVEFYDAAGIVKSNAG